MSVCRSCDAPIYWIKTAKGQAMPIDARPDPNRGNVRLVAGGSGVVLSHDEARARRAAGEALHTSHFATCVHAAQHRRG